MASRGGHRRRDLNECAGVVAYFDQPLETPVFMVTIPRVTE
jgi:hypothetical protein